MAATGYTPIQLYRTATAAAAPVAANLAAGELSINYNDADMALYAKNASGVVKRLINNPAGLKYPTADGTANQVIVTDGSGNLSFSSAGGVTSFSAGTTGFTPNTATTGAVSLSGTLNAANGGTGQSSYAIGDILYASGASALSRLADVATGNALISGGVTTAPSWGKIGLTTHVTGTLGAGNGGTGIASYTVGDILYASASGTLSALADVATGNALISGGVGTAPSWGKIALGTHVSGTLPVANGGTGQTTYTDGQLLIGNTVGNTLTKATLTAGTGVTITNGNGSITIAATGTSGVTSFSAGTTGLTPNTATTGAVSLAGTLVVGNGGTGVATLTGIVKGNGTSAFSAATAGTDYVAPATATTFTAAQTFNGSSSSLACVLANAAETTTISATAATGTIAYDVTTQSVLYYTTNASANWTVNFRASSGTALNTAMATGQTVTVVFLVTQGGTAFYNSAVQVDGASVTPKWQGGTAPTSGNTSSVDVYTYTIVKTGNAAFTVFASQTKFA